MMADAHPALGLLWAAGFLGGLAWFFKGFREYRVLEDTPLVPIRSMALGLTHVHGQAKGTTLLTSPVTRSECFFFKVDIEKWVHDSSGRWWHENTVAQGLPFCLQDGSGCVLVSPCGAEVDLPESGRREIGASLGHLLETDDQPPGTARLADTAPTDDELRGFVERSAGALDRLALGLEGEPASGSGTLPSPGPEWILRPAVSPSGRFRLSEFCILPEHWYDVTGTCMENRASRDPVHRQVITKGVHEPTFLISWRSEPGVESRLRHRAVLNVLGGAALSLGCLVFLLLQLGQL